MKRIRILLIAFLIVLVGIFLFWKDIENLYFQISGRVPEIQKEVTNFLIEKVEKQIVTPPPLRAVEETPESFLTKAGVIEWTNKQREKYGLPKLKENIELDQSAELKAQDMFKNQYFAHSSPSGVTVGDLADQVGYQFIAIGENLALGNFGNDEILVQAWMDSPGHRANILNSHYQEIGISVLKGVFEGRTTWLAVQHFGLSLSACPQPDETIRAIIENSQNKINEVSKELEALQAEINAIASSRSQAYRDKINQYNELVTQYNLLVQQTKTVVNQYNNQVKSFNECIGGTQ